MSLYNSNSGGGTTRRQDLQWLMGTPAVAREGEHPTRRDTILAGRIMVERLHRLLRQCTLRPRLLQYSLPVGHRASSVLHLAA